MRRGFYAKYLYTTSKSIGSWPLIPFAQCKPDGERVLAEEIRRAGTSGKLLDIGPLV